MALKIKPLPTENVTLNLASATDFLVLCCWLVASHKNNKRPIL